MQKWLSKLLNLVSSHNDKEEFVLVRDDILHQRWKDIYKYGFYTDDYKDKLEWIIKLNETADKISKETALAHSYIKIKDCQLWYDKIPLMVFNLLKIFNPITLLTEEDIKYIEKAIDVMDEEWELVKEQPNFKGFKGYLGYNLSDHYVNIYASYNKCQKEILSTLINLHRCNYLASFFNDLDIIVSEANKIQNLNFMLPYNSVFLRNMLYHYNIRGIDLYEKTMEYVYYNNSSKDISYISKDVNESEMALNLLDYAVNDAKIETIEISETIHNMFFHSYKYCVANETIKTMVNNYRI